MPLVAWLHLTDADMSRARAVIDAFREDDTVDVLGFQPISEKFDDWFYPAVTTPMTRARYYLFVPAIYAYLEKLGLDLSMFREEAKRLQYQLQRRLSEAERPGRGVIGEAAQEDIKRLPSAIYWRSIAKLGMLRGEDGTSEWSETQYQLAATARTADDVIRTDEGDERYGEPTQYWDPELPTSGVARGREGLRRKLALKLNSPEAAYLRRRFLAMPGGRESLLGVRLTKRLVDQHDHAWSALDEPGVPEALREKLQHARSFSAVARVLSLIYYALVLERQKAQRVGVGGYQDELGRLEEEGTHWWQHGRRFVRGWNGAHFQDLVGPVCATSDREDFQLVVQLARSGANATDLFRSAALRGAVKKREERKRPGKCRLCGRPQHLKYLKQWKGPPNKWESPFQLSFRHHRGDTIVRDLLQQPYVRRFDVQD